MADNPGVLEGQSIHHGLVAYVLWVTSFEIPMLLRFSTLGWILRISLLRDPRWLKRWVCYFSFFVMFLILFFNGFYIFFPGRFTVADLFTSYFAPIFYIVLYVFWKIWKRTKIISPEEADITTGKQEVDELDQYYADIEEARALKQPSTNVTWLSILREKFTHAC